MRRAKRVAVLLGMLASGCHLVDQRDFNPRAGEPPAAPKTAAAAPTGPGALVTIRYTVPEPAYASELAVAVRRALELKRNVLFTVEAHVPLAGDADAQAASLKEAAPSAREIAEAIVADGADPSQTEIAVRTDPLVRVREVRVYVH